MRDLTQEEIAKKLIYSLDLTRVAERVKRLQKWSKKQVLEACEQYRVFLFLVKKYGKQYQLAPSRDIDEIWHAHILHTQDYTEFCEKLFGFYLHHCPSHIVKLKDQEKIPRMPLESAFKMTLKFYLEETGSPLYAVRPISFKVKRERIKQQLKSLLNPRRHRSMENELI